MKNATHLCKSILLLALTLVVFSCGPSAEEKARRDKIKAGMETPTDPMENKGIGPVKSITLAGIDQAMAEEGKGIFDASCTACHKVEKRFIGPSPMGIMSRRSPEWIMNMILNPEEMVAKDPVAKQLLIDYNGAPMANQNLTEEQARKILEYFRTL